MNLHDFGPQHNAARSLLPALLIPETGTAPHTIAAPASISKMDFAIEAARRGFSVFLLDTGTNVPLIPTWRKVATPDPDQIRGCWALCADANVGISTKTLLTLRITERCPPET